MPFSVNLHAAAAAGSLPVRCELEINRNSVEGLIRTLWWPPRQSQHSPDTVLVFTTGNPGIPEWYIEFLSIIRENTASSKLAILAHGFIGHAHDLEQPSSTFSLSLPSQVEACIGVLNALREEFPNTRFILVGHSVGGFINLKTFRHFQKSVRLIIGVTPTVSFLSTTPNGRIMTPILNSPFIPLIAWLGALLCYLFPFLLPFIQSDWPRHQLLVLRNFVSSSAATTASMTLARDEMCRVMELDENMVAQAAPKLRVLYSESGDDWVGGNSAQVVQIMNNSTHVKFSPIPHAFCINHNAETAKACLPWIDKEMETD